MLLMDYEDIPPPVVIISITLDLVGQYTAEKEIQTQILIMLKNIYMNFSRYEQLILSQ